jgi:hypothetical protein
MSDRNPSINHDDNHNPNGTDDTTTNATNARAKASTGVDLGTGDEDTSNVERAAVRADCTSGKGVLA